MKAKEHIKELERQLRSEQERTRYLQKIIDLCRCKYGDAAINTLIIAIRHQSDEEVEMHHKDWEKCLQTFQRALLRNNI